jgi:hypothetical protein
LISGLSKEAEKINIQRDTVGRHGRPKKRIRVDVLREPASFYRDMENALTGQWWKGTLASVPAGQY